MRGLGLRKHSVETLWVVRTEVCGAGAGDGKRANVDPSALLNHGRAALIDREERKPQQMSQMVRLMGTSKTLRPKKTTVF